MIMKIVSFLLALSLSPLCAQDVLDVRVHDETVEDAAAGRVVEVVDVVPFGAGEKAYLDFSGRGALIIPADAALSFGPQDTLWVEFWIHPTRSAAVPLLSKGSGANYRLGLQKTGEPVFSYYSSGSWQSLTASEPLETDQWQHLGLWFDSGSREAALFINGRVVAVSNDMQPFQSRDNQPLYIGAVPLKEQEGYQGFVGDMGRIIISRENPRNIPGALNLDQSVFSVQPWP